MRNVVIYHLLPRIILPEKTSFTSRLAEMTRLKASDPNRKPV
jgi:hypothetical protein